MNEKQNKKDWVNNYYVNFIIGLLFILLIALVPYVFTRQGISCLNFSKTGEIGDTIGGITSPFIGVAAVIVTWLAFVAQYNANRLQIRIFNKQFEENKQQFEQEQNRQRKNVELQQFENKFYEMLRIHKENVNEIEISTKEGSVRGREVFLEQKKELEYILYTLQDDELNAKSFRKIYELFFWGESGDIPLSNVFFAIKNSVDDSHEEGTPIIEKLRKNIKGGNLDTIAVEAKLKISFLSGHYSYLGHYYRHLFHTVKLVVDEALIDEKQKLTYLQILRAQLSNHEQIMLFYNWLGYYGDAWENGKEQMFTKYKMIHNLWYHKLYKNEFVKSKLKELVEEYKKLEREEDLFEIGDDIDKIF